MGFLKRHWNKLALGLFTSFWTGCADKPLDNPPSLYGCPPDICSPTNENQETPSDEEKHPESSSSTEDGSSSENVKNAPKDNGEREHGPAPVYGAPAVYERD